MRIGVISDTHIPGSSDTIPEKVLNGLGKCDMIIHAGDITEKYVINDLDKIAKTYAVHGNMDSMEVRSAYPDKIVIPVEDKKIGVTHGIGVQGNVIESVQNMFLKEKPDVIIFGHTHSALSQEINRVLFFNPGSVNDRISVEKRSYGIIIVDNGAVESEIIYLN